MTMTPKEIAHTIRIIALTCRNNDTMSCEFGNEFSDKVEKLIEEMIEDIK